MIFFPGRGVTLFSVQNDFFSDLMLQGGKRIIAVVVVLLVVTDDVFVY